MAQDAAFEGNAGAGQVIETRLFFTHSMGLSLTGTFVPGTSNQRLDEQLANLNFEGADVVLHEGEITLREVVLILLERLVRSGDEQAIRAEEAMRDWIDSLSDDTELLQDDSIVVHTSPLSWESLVEQLKKSPEAALFAYTMSVGGDPIEAVHWVIAFGASRILLRLVGGGEAIIADRLEAMRRKTLPGYQPKRDQTVLVDSTVIKTGSGQANATSEAKAVGTTLTGPESDEAQIDKGSD